MLLNRSEFAFYRKWLFEGVGLCRTVRVVYDALVLLREVQR
jgi:hypothetical protein